MLQYDNTQLLTFLHIPKTAGTSIRDLFVQWYGNDNIIQCYNKEIIRIQQYKAYRAKQPNTVLYGHFSNQSRCILEISQIVTILRDPFNRAVSEYFHRKRKKTLKDGVNSLFEYKR